MFFFLMWASLEIFSPHNPPFGGIFPKKPNPPGEGGYHIALFSYMVLIVSEAFLILFTIDFAIGLYFVCMFLWFINVYLAEFQSWRPISTATCHLRKTCYSAHVGTKTGAFSVFRLSYAEGSAIRHGRR